MAESYYYFASALPLLVDIDSKLPFSSEEFLADCQRLLIKEDYYLAYQVLVNAGNGIQTENTTIKNLIQFDQDFRNELAFYRAEYAKQDPSDHVRGEKSSALGLVEAINPLLKANELLEVEKTLDRIRWKNYDYIGSGHFYNLEYIIIYGLKLRIVERYETINSPKGKEIFEEYKKIEIPI